ncbi:Hypothetical protein I596_36 [Dokdonella koreensis DS-123]|uniref:Uncharacterized protein n=1 Tax=Dokdonella koreensis DS-123 TaxID=1300342 RepID=A0A167G284_9GAMM|nr:Hypothetical protein I596_36 [Dokdonella koreensis DS-123]
MDTPDEQREFNWGHHSGSALDQTPRMPENATQAPRAVPM